VKYRITPLGLGAAAAIAVFPGTAGQASAAPIVPGDLGSVPDRTALTFTDSNTGWSVGTANQFAARPGLSTVKLYIADFVLQHGDGSATDRELAERMIRFSDDGAASRLYAKYPNSIDGPAAQYGLTATSGAAFWGNSYTSTADTVRFLEVKKAQDPRSPILGWMRDAAPAAADGTYQDWGTARLPGAEGTKWGWSDYGPPVVNSATIGNGYSVAAATNGTAADQTTDVLRAFGPAPQPSPTVPLRDVVADVVATQFPGDPIGGWVVDAVPSDIVVASAPIEGP